MRRRRRRRPPRDGIELNLAAMLDMAFQLLMFFILTFNPAPREAQIAAYLAAPRPITVPPDPGEESATLSQSHDVGADEQRDGGKEQSSEANRVVVQVRGGSSNSEERLAVDDKQVQSLEELNAALHDALVRLGARCTGLAVRVDAETPYERVMEVVEICMIQKAHDGQTLAQLRLVEVRR